MAEELFEEMKRLMAVGPVVEDYKSTLDSPFRQRHFAFRLAICRYVVPRTWKYRGMPALAGSGS